MFVCGTALETTAGMEDKLDSNFEKSKQLLAEAGYKGEPVVLLHSTDLPVLTNIAPVAKSLLERGGFVVDMQSMDWQTVLSRRVRKDPPSQGGWNAMVTYWSSADVLNPVMGAFFNASGDKAAFGWPNDPKMEELRRQFALAGTPEERKSTAEAVQLREAESPTHIVLGQFNLPGAARSNVAGSDSGSSACVLEHRKNRRVRKVGRPAIRPILSPSVERRISHEFNILFVDLLPTVPVMLVVAALVFLMLRLTPGDPAAIIAGDNATPQQLLEIRQKLGLEEPVVTQYFVWLGQIVTGNFGDSFFFKKTVWDLISDRIEPTLSLSVVTILLAVTVAIPLGAIAAYRQGTIVDRVVMSVSVLGFSIPVFEVIGYLLVYVFAIELKWLPVQGYQRITGGIGPWFKSLVLPAITLSVIYIALIARMTRTSMLEVLSEDYVRTARAKGQTEAKVLFGHALKNAAVPIVTVVGLGVALLIGGVVVTESVFSIPGLGRLTVDAVLARDFPVIQAIILLFAFVYVLINLIVDLSYNDL